MKEKKGRLNRPPKSAIRRWGSLFLGVLIIVLFTSVIAPWIMELPYVRDVNKVIQDRGIEANTYFYTETEEFDEADDYMTEALKDSPTGSGLIILGWVIFGTILWIGYRFLPLD